MRSVSVRLEDLKTMILNLGFAGENEHTRVTVDCKKMYDQYPHASASMTVQPPEGEAYPAVIERDGDYVIWDVTDSDLIAEGSGELQLSFTQEPHLAKSYTGRFKVGRSIIPTGEVPEGIDDFLTRAGAALTGIPETINSALAAAKASGEFDGPQGPAGQDGADGQDGFSPVVVVSAITGGHQVSVTDAEGTETFDVMDGVDGVDGQDGAPGQDGVDGVTPEISIGTVTSGSTPAASMDNTDPAHPVLSLTLQKGDKGDTGDPAPSEWVVPAVDAFLENVISNPDSPPLDRTLTSNVSAAPADMVGDLKSALSGYNFWVYGTITKNRAIASNGGTTSNADYDSTDYIPVTPGEIIYGYGSRYAFYDSTKTFISGTSAILNTTGTLLANGMHARTVPDGAAYFRICAQKSLAKNQFFITKATGYENEAMSMAVIGNLLAVIGNLWDYGAVTEGVSVKNDGSTTSNADYKTTDYIPVVEGEIIYGNGARYAFYDSTKTFVPNSSQVLSTTGIELPNEMRYCSVPLGASYFRICAYKTGVTSFPLYKGSIFDAITYAAFGGNPDYTKKSVYYNNLWRYGTLTYNVALVSSGGTTANVDYDTTDYIPVNEGDIIYGYGSRYCFYNSEKTMLSGKTGILNTDGEPIGNGMHYIKTPTGASYFRVCGDKNPNLVYQFLLYIASPFESNRTEGTSRKLYCLGDSITRGMYAEQGASSSSGPTDKGYPYWIGQLAGYDVVNLGNSGSGWANVGTAETPDDPSTARNAKDVVDDNAFSDADIITMAWGVNDWKGAAQNVVLGDMTSVSGDGTVIGNMKYCIETLVTKKPTAQLIVLLPLNTNRKWTGMRDMTLEENWAFGYAYRNNQTLQDYRTAIRQCAEYYNVKVIDLEEVCPINRLNLRNMCGDGLHPTKAFHKQMGEALANLVS